MILRPHFLVYNQVWFLITHLSCLSSPGSPWLCEAAGVGRGRLTSCEAQGPVGFQPDSEGPTWGTGREHGGPQH